MRFQVQVGGGGLPYPAIERSPSTLTVFGELAAAMSNRRHPCLRYAGACHRLLLSDWAPCAGRSAR